VDAASADGVVVQEESDSLFNYHPASQSLGTPPKQGGELMHEKENKDEF
jgi:hypothetical protein